MHPQIVFLHYLSGIFGLVVRSRPEVEQKRLTKVCGNQRSVASRGNLA
jgi:hypothetical protein